MRQHDLPAGLGVAPLVRGRSSIEIIECLRSHTIAAYYLPFLSRDDQNMIGCSIRDGRSQHWRRRVSGVSRTRPLSHPLKWCQQCRETDENLVGRAYWHTAFQFPTTWTCNLHDAPLRMIKNPGKRWLLPSTAQPEHEFNAKASNSKYAVALAAVGSALQSIDSIDIPSLRSSAVHRLREIGVVHSLSGCHHHRIEKWFSSAGASSIFENPILGLQHLTEGDWIPALLWRRKLTHAVRWVALWASLEWDSPAIAAQSFEHAASGGSVSAGGQIQLFDSEHMQERRAPPKVQEAFANSASYGDVMARLRVSRSDVVRWLEDDPMLRAEWRARLRRGKQSECVSRIRALAARATNVARAQIEAECGTEVQWLREHAPEQLRDLLKSLPARASAQRHLWSSY